jgi:excisionase family DNA binding protein
MSQNLQDLPRLLYTTEEAAAQLAIGVTKAKELISSGELRSIKVGRLRRVTASSLAEYVQVRELQALGVHT